MGDVSESQNYVSRFQDATDPDAVKTGFPYLAQIQGDSSLSLNATAAKW